MAADTSEMDEDPPMSRASAIKAFASRQWTARSVPWIGAVLIGVIVVLAATDIVRGYRRIPRRITTISNRAALSLQ